MSRVLYRQTNPGLPQFHHPQGSKRLAHRSCRAWRNIYSVKDAKRAGFDAYISIIRTPLEPAQGDA
jgi:hypothetical protein